MLIGENGAEFHDFVKNTRIFTLKTKPSENGLKSALRIEIIYVLQFSFE